MISINGPFHDCKYTSIFTLRIFPSFAVDTFVKAPILANVTDSEKEAVATMFRYYDHSLKGSISKQLAKNLFRSLGFDLSTNDTMFSARVTLNEIFLLLDQVI